MHKNQSFLLAFINAFKGLNSVLSEKPRTLFVMLAITVLVILAGVYFHITRFEWAILFLCIGMVIGLEIINTAIEKWLDKFHPGFDPEIGKIKDISAGAVLWVSVCAAVAGFVIFFRHVQNWLTQ